MSLDTHRLSILTTKEIDALYSLPRFTTYERQIYFDLSSPERAAVYAHTPAVAVHLMLQLGYFKAKRQFFQYEAEAEMEVVSEDLQYVQAQYFPGKAFELLTPLTPLSRPTRLALQQTILTLFDYRQCDRAARGELEHKAQRIALLSTQPIYVLREVLQHLATQRIVAPPYTILQDMVGRVVTRERHRLTQLLGQSLTPTVAHQIDILLDTNETVYRISALKREASDFSYKALRQEVERRKFFQPLYDFAQTFLATAGISTESGKYYASLVKFYTVYKLQRMPLATARLYLLCFAYYRFGQINDTLIEAFIHLVDHYEQQARQAAEEARQRAVAEVGEDLQAAGQILSLFVDNSIPADAPFMTVQKKAFALLDPARFPAVSDYMRNIAFDKTGFEWSYYTTLSPTFKRNLRHLFSDLDFVGRVEDAPLLEGITFLQSLLRHGKSPRQTNPSLFPTALIPKMLQRYLFARGKGRAGGVGKGRLLEVDRYEFLLYRLLRNALEAGDVFVRDSTEFRRFEDDLISDGRWQDKERILNEIGAPLLLAPIQETLRAFRETLEAKFQSVNQRIADGRNQHIKITGSAQKRRWTLKYPLTEEPVNSPFYDRLPGIGIAELLWFVAEQTAFLGTFTHILDRYVKHDPDPRAILACIVALGTNMGLWKMADVSGLSHSTLMTTARNYLRLETLHSANDAITNATARLAVFSL
jgi:hypothetical protein